jgi:diguanylate cyclase (GGDEF)-like protein
MVQPSDAAQADWPAHFASPRAKPGAAHDACGATDPWAHRGHDCSTRRVPKALPVCVLLLCMLLFGPVAAAAERLSLQVFGTADGLPQQQVLALHQDARGYLWLATYAGLGRYNGREFRVYSTAEGLASNAIQALGSTRDGRVWVGTTRGLCRYDDAGDRFDCPDLTPLPAVSIQALASNGNGLLVGTSAGLFQLMPPNGSEQLDTPQVRTVVADLNITSLAPDSDGSVWIGTHTGLLRWFSLSGQYASVHLPLNTAPLVAALHAEPGRLWIGSSAGLLLMEDEQVRPAPGLPESARGMAISALLRGPEGELWASGNRGLLRGPDDALRLLGTEHGLANAVTHSLLRDREGAVWIGGDGGLARWQPTRFEGFTRADGLVADFVRSLREDRNERLWIGTREGVQVLERAPSGRGLIEAARIGRAEGLVDPRVYDITVLDASRALIATEHGVADWRAGEGVVRLFTEADGLPVNAARSLRAEADGRVWIGTMTGLALLREGRIQPVADPLLAVARVLAMEASGENLWFASLHHGLLRMDPRGSVSRFGRAEGLSDEIIWDLAADGSGGLWIGSNGDGLFHRAADGTLRRFTRADGLPDNFIWSVLDDGQRGVWAYTSHGLAHVHAGGIETYSEADGLLHPEGAATAALRAADGSLWFGTGSGLVRHRPEVAAPELPTLTVRIERATAGGEHLSAGQRLPSASRDISIQFAAILLGHSSDLRYRYRLRGASEAWSEPLPYQPITFAALPAGAYVFEVQARHGRGDWGPATEFDFTLAPALWEHRGAQIGALTAVLLLLLLGFRLRVRALEQGRQRLRSEVDRRTRDLAEANQRLEQASLTDPLTGLPNRRYLLRQIQADVAQCRRALRAPPTPGLQRDLLFLMVDIDNFKRINDAHGHGVGDEVLRHFAAALSGLIRESDYAVRWGGEEFLIIARQADAAQAGAMAERICAHMRSLRVRVEHGLELGCSCSVGVAALPFIAAAPDALEWEQVIALADAAAYLAKARGRDGWVELSPAGTVGASDVPDLLEAARQLTPNPSPQLLQVRGLRGGVQA